MKATEIRSSFLEFFKSKGHTPVPSSSLVPANDPTLLFANSGMVQFKDCFLGGDKRSYTRATSCQKCLRISGKHNDFENVGMTSRHGTFFEMMGNFSFGDYFKPDAIKYAWEFVTKVLGIPKNRLWATVFEKDDESAKLWKDLTDIIPDRILRMTAKDNFWEMGDVGPCGPSSEIFVYLGSDVLKQSEADFRKDDGTYVEIWNLVFMQFERAKDGTLTPLPKPSVDTGMGLERTATVVQGVKGMFDCDLIRGIITECENLSGFKYDGSSYAIRDLRADIPYARDVAMRVIADHSRSAAFLLADGVMPASDGRGYVLRRIIRRALRHGKVLQFKEPFFAKTADKVISLMGGHYAELREGRDLILKVLRTEEEKFYETLDSGLVILQREVEKLGPNDLFPGEAAFLLHDTYGFPLDLTQDALKSYKRQVDVPKFEAAMSAQKDRSREDRKGQSLVFTTTNIQGAPTEFRGYKEYEIDAKISHVLTPEGKPGKITKGGLLSLAFNATPFYGESGGQVGDTGVISVNGTKLRVLDTQKTHGKYFIHSCEVIEGEIDPSFVGKSAHLAVDRTRREKIRANHSATHLVHAALREVLGTHVKQAGSRVDDRSLRFDYSHFEPINDEQREEIQKIVNDQIRGNFEVVTSEMPIEAAKKRGAMALFGEKYGDVVRVVEIGPKSLELCGGTHVSRSGDIGIVLISSEGGISSGVRRIECLSASGAHDAILKEHRERLAIANLLKSDPHDLPEKVEKALSKTKSLEKELDSLRQKMASEQSKDLSETCRTSPKGVKVIAERIDSVDTDTLRTMVDRLRLKIGSGVVALGTTQGEKGLIVAGVTADLTNSINAGKLVGEVAKFSGGRGGGRADFAQAGGLDPEKIIPGLEKLVELIP